MAIETLTVYLGDEDNSIEGNDHIGGSRDVDDNQIVTIMDDSTGSNTFDGGNITLDSIENDTLVKVQLEGACTSCTVNQMTLKSGVEMMIKKYAPQVESVINIEA